MTLLDDRIKKDLEELYNNGKGINKLIEDFNNRDIPLSQLKEDFQNCKISAAEDLSLRLFGVPTAFSIHGLPGYFTGDRGAETVMVMLNPGQDVAGKDNPGTTEETLKKLRIDINTTLDKFISTYQDGNRDFGKKQAKPDKFDVKQATFLKPWDGSGIKFDRFDPTSDKIKPEDKLNAVKAVLMDKLQLELVPYASQKFDGIETDKLQCLFPFVKTLLDEIFAKKRTYVILAGEIFERLFENKQQMHIIGASVKFGDLKFPNPPLQTKDKQDSKTPFKCRKIVLTYNGKEQEALIAHTYAVQFGGEIFYHYGKFCHSIYNHYDGNWYK